MQLSAGTRVGPYQVVAPLGAGGMGEVYRARDARLARDVAIKILPALMSLDAEHLARFRREALALAALNHPHVATIYGVEEVNGGPALAMELVEGPSLAARIETGPLTVDEALRIARQIAEGLDAAHRRGIVHRDLKPDNVRLTGDGRVKLLDFGIARLRDRDGRAPVLEQISDAPTVSGGPLTTSMGLVLGTAAYMSPEQARGEEVDHRADIWAFGCVLFEMLTGRRALSGSTHAEILAAILHAEPDWSALPLETPPPVRRLLARSLQKRLDRRLDSARDAILEIDDALGGAEPLAPTSAAVRGRWLTPLPWIVSALCLAALILLLAASRRAQPAVVSKLAIALPQHLVETGRPTVALSPDGSRIAVVGQRGETTAVYVRPTDGFDAVAIPGTDAASSVAFSPDGEWIAFYAEGRLRKVSIRGGPPIALARLSDFMGASWSRQDSIIVSTAGGDLLSVPDSGGDATPLWPGGAQGAARVDRGLPHVLPGSRGVLYTLAQVHEAQGSIAVRALPTGDERILVRDATHASYVDGWLIYARTGSLFAAPFDAGSLTLAGPATPVLDGVSFSRAFGTTGYAVSSTGTLVYVPASVTAGRQLATVDRDGAVTTALGGTRRAYFMPRLAADGHRLAVTILEDGAYGVWAGNLEGSAAKIADHSFGAVWSPDGQRLAFATTQEERVALTITRADGSGRSTVATDAISKVPTAWTPDGRALLFTRIDPSRTGEDIYVVAADGSGMRPLIATPANESGATISPDGKWLAFGTSNGATTRGVSVVPLSDPTRQSHVDAPAAAMPVWSRSGGELFFLGGPQLTVLMSVTVADDRGTPTLGRPRAILEQNMGGSIGFGLPRYDVMPDGRRFVFATAETASPGKEIRLLFDWPAELRKLTGR